MLLRPIDVIVDRESLPAVARVRSGAHHDEQVRERHEETPYRRDREIRGGCGWWETRIRTWTLMITVALVQDPVNKGGIATVVKWYEEWMTVHGRSRHTYYLDEKGPSGIGRLWHWDPSNAAVPRVLPRAHLPMYAAARLRMSGTWRGVEEVHVIGASSMHGSLAPTNVASLVWLGTLISDERSLTLGLQQLPRRLLYRSTLGPLTRIESTVLSRASRILAQSPHTADLIVAQGLAPVNRVEVRTVPIDTDVFAPPEPDRERTGMLFVGRSHDPRKAFGRIASLIESSPIARAVGVDVVSPIAPRPTDGIRWRGQVENLSGIYGESALLLLPSIQEGLGIVAFEALACGTPVVAYRCGGPDRLLAESGGAILVENESTFRSAVEELLADQSARAEMGAAGRSYVVDTFSAKNFLADASLFSVCE